jgi:hypothetical protein
MQVAPEQLSALRNHSYAIDTNQHYHVTGPPQLTSGECKAFLYAGYGISKQFPVLTQIIGSSAFPGMVFPGTFWAIATEKNLGPP